MNRLSVFASAIVLTATSVFAQGGNVYSPAWLESTEGGLYGYYFGRYANGRYQMCDAEANLTGKQIKEIALRLDGRNHTTSTAMGHSWTNVTIVCGQTDYANFTSTWATNRKGGETQVFSASVNWPTFSGTPITTPALWGGTTGAYRFPFTTNYSHTTGDFMAEFEFTGGTLANNLAWSGSSSRYYYWDGYGSPTGSNNSTFTYIPTSRLNNNSAGVTGRCNDSEHGTTTTGSYCLMVASAYGGLYSNINWRGKLRYYTYSYYTGYENPVLHGVSFANNPTGVDLNTGCNKLHLSGPLVVVPHMTLPQAASSSGYSGYYEFLIPFTAPMANLSVTVQAAWSDSSTNTLNLSQARNAILPGAVPPSSFPKRIMTYRYPSSGTTYPTAGFAPLSQYYGNPAFCYTHN